MPEIDFFSPRRFPKNNLLKTIETLAIQSNMCVYSCDHCISYQMDILISAIRDCFHAGVPITPPLFYRRGRVIEPPAWVR